MSVLRQLNVMGQMRLDVPHIRSIESSICADFDLLAGRIIAGRVPLVVQGFGLISAGLGASPNDILMQVADSVLIHYMASASGSIYQVPADRPNETLSSLKSTRVEGSFVANLANYIGLDLIRSIDPATSDLVMFLDTTTLATETSKNIPLARTLDYKIIISQSDFGANASVAPIAVVTTDSAGNIAVIQDARNSPWRLGSGGNVPDPAHTFPWPGGRTESLATPFVGGDKAISCFKEWADAIMTRLWELGGGESWYGPTSTRNVRVVPSGPTVFGNGKHFELLAENLHWRGLVVLRDNGPVEREPIQDQLTNNVDQTDLVDGDCLYVDLSPTDGSELVAVRAPIATLGISRLPGNRFVLAWRDAGQVFIREQSEHLVPS